MLPRAGQFAARAVNAHSVASRALAHQPTGPAVTKHLNSLRQPVKRFEPLMDNRQP